MSMAWYKRCNSIADAQEFHVFLAISHMYHFSLHQTRSVCSMPTSEVTPVPIGYIQLTWDQDDVMHQTPWKLCMLYRTENQFSTTFSNFKHAYTKKFYWSSHIFHWSSHFFISRGPRTDKFRRVWCTEAKVKHIYIGKLDNHWFR